METIVAVIMLVLTIIFGWGPFRDRMKSRKNKKRSKPKDQLGISVLDTILSAKVAKVGFFRYAPFIDYDPEAQDVNPSGLYADLMKAVADKHGLTVKYGPMNIGDCVQSVEKGAVDFVLCVFQTLERVKRADFTALLHLVTAGGVVRMDETRIATPADLGKDHIRVVVAKGEVGSEIAEQFFGMRKKHGRLIEVDVDDISKIVAFVESGNADIALADSISCKRFIEEKQTGNQSVKQVFEKFPIFICPNGIMIRKGQQDLRDWLDHEIREARTIPEIMKAEQNLLNKWDGILARLG